MWVVAVSLKKKNDVERYSSGVGRVDSGEQGQEAERRAWWRSTPFVYYLLREREAGFLFFFSSRRRHTRLVSDWSSDVCSSDLRVRADARVRVDLRRLPRR